jgi:hypothetical protein
MRGGVPATATAPADGPSSKRTSRVDDFQLFSLVIDAGAVALKAAAEIE